MKSPKLLHLAAALLTSLALAASPALAGPRAGTAPVAPSASLVRIDGYVADGVGHNWGVYAKVTLASGGSFGTAVVYSSPQTGYYFADVYAGETYTLTVEPVYPGYNSTTAVITPAAATVQNFALTVARGACTAPGYQKTASAVASTENFDLVGVGAIPAGWTAISNPPGTAWGAQTSGTAINATVPVSAPNLLEFPTWALALGDYGRIYRTNPADLSGFGSVLSFYLYQVASPFPLDTVQVQVSTDGAATWQNLGAPIPTASYASGWKRFWVPLDGITGNVATAQIGIKATKDGINSSAVQIDNLELSVNNCVPVQGAMIIGNILSANTGTGINEATVTHDLGGSTLSFATPLDPAVDDGFYFLFAPIPGVPPAARSVTASKVGYDSASSTVLVPADGVIRLNLSLTSSLFLATPSFLTIRADAGAQGFGALTVQNNGTGSGSYSILERRTPPAGFFPGVRPYRSGPVPTDVPVTPWAGFGQAAAKPSPGTAAVGTGTPFIGGAVQGASAVACDEFGYWVFGGLSGLSVSGDISYYDARQNAWFGWPGAMPVPGAYMGAGCVNGYIFLSGGFIDAFTITDAFRVFDTLNHTWVTTVMPGGAKAAQAGVTANGKLYLLGGWDGVTPATSTNLMFDPNTGTFSGLSSMPAARFLHSAAAVGSKLYVAGGFDNADIAMATTYRFDPAGNTWSTGPALPNPRAYRPALVNYGDQLFIVGGQSGNLVNFVIDPTTMRYDPSTWPLGSWAAVPTAALATPVADTAYAATYDKIWLAAGFTSGFAVSVHQFIDEGLDASFPNEDLPYISEDPASGIVPAGAANVVTVTFDTTASDKFGLHTGELAFISSGPQVPTKVGFALTKAFLDVPAGAFGDNEIHGLAGARITYGVPGSLYLPNNLVTRAEMAIFLTRATQGYAFIPPFPGPGMNSFADVTYDYWAANYIEFIYNPAAHNPVNAIPQITIGCSVSPLMYCPEETTTRAQMAAFLSRAAFGGATHAEPTPVFSDVPADHPYRGFIEELWWQEVTNGCGGGMYCPDRAITRAEMAIFLVRTFAIPYLH